MSPDPTEISPRNYWLNVLDGVFFPAGYAFMGPATVLPLFVASLTDSRLVVGLAGALLMLGLALPQLWCARLTLRMPRFWPWFLGSNLLVRLAVLPLVVVPFLPTPWRLPSFLVAITLFAAAWGMAVPTWGEFVGRVVPAGRRGAFFGLRGSLQGPASVLATLGATALLALLPAPWCFAACFSAAFALKSLSYACLALTRVPWQAEIEPPAPEAPYWRSLIDKLRARPAFGRYTLCRLIVATAAASSGFWVIGAQQRFTLTTSQANLLGLALLALPTLTGFWWGRLGDRKGPRAQLWAAIALGAVANLLMACAGQLWIYVGAMVLVGVTTSLLVMADYAVIYDTCPEERATFFGLSAVLLLPATLGGPLLAGAVADRWGMAAVFAGSALTWILAGLGVLLAWPGARSPQGKQVLT